MNKHQQRIILAFLLPIYILSVLNLVWPDQPISELENRALQVRPSLSWAELINGNFGQKVEAWFADQFPFRNHLIRANNGVKALFSLSFLYDEHVTLVQRPAKDLGHGQILTDHESTMQQSPTENTAKTQAQINYQTENSEDHLKDKNTNDVEANNDLTKATETELYVKADIQEDLMPVETEPIDLPNIEGPVEDYTAVIIIEQKAMEVYGFSETKADYYIATLNKLVSNLPGTSNFYCLLAPTSIEFYSPEKYHSLSSSQLESIEYIYKKLDPRYHPIDAYSELAANWQEYIYFRSDHHWTALGAYYGYRAFAKTANIVAVELDNLSHGYIPGNFLGSLYLYTQSHELQNNPDRVEYFEPQVKVEGFAYSNTQMTDGRQISLINKNASSGNQYLSFIEGDHPLAYFSTETKNKRSIIVIKESYGNAFVPYLASHYERIFVIDPRNINADLVAFIIDQQIDDVLVLNYTFAVTNQYWVDGLAKMIH